MGNQAVSLQSLALFRSAVPVSRASFHSTDTSTAQKNNRLKKPLFFSLFRSSSSHTHFLRSSWLMHPQYSFIPLHSAGCVSLHSSIMSAPLVNCAVAPSHSHQGWLSSVKTSLCPKSRFPAKAAAFYCFPAVARS